MSRHMIERTTVRLPQSLLAQARAKARSQGRTLTSLIEDGLRLVTATQPEDRRERILPPVSGSKGGFKAGIDPDIKFSELQELEDLEYMERLKRFR